MIPFLLAGFLSVALGWLLSIVAVFIILLVLVQRGRGGGLTGALGGMGGQSAFGAKAGDVFTRVTIATSAIWIILCIISVKQLGPDEDPLDSSLGSEKPRAVGRRAAPLGGQSDSTEAETSPKKNTGGKLTPPSSSGTNENESNTSS